ncbi:unnamed protein product [Acanthosepion pharaonis]|uniref:Uncharacterized protein n=1 Tax=Acanthosepion pharaonis TaxID=158019 RepID=A0A812BEF6_ACAPH|nr:unnamed protein product [Sepia pharaonis]
MILPLVLSFRPLTTVVSSPLSWSFFLFLSHDSSPLYFLFALSQLIPLTTDVSSPLSWSFFSSFLMILPPLYFLFALSQLMFLLLYHGRFFSSSLTIVLYIPAFLTFILSFLLPMIVIPFIAWSRLFVLFLYHYYFFSFLMIDLSFSQNSPFFSPFHDYYFSSSIVLFFLFLYHGDFIFSFLMIVLYFLPHLNDCSFFLYSHDCAFFSPNHLCSFFSSYMVVFLFFSHESSFFTPLSCLFSIFLLSCLYFLFALSRLYFLLLYLDCFPFLFFSLRVCSFFFLSLIVPSFRPVTIIFSLPLSCLLFFFIIILSFLQTSYFFFLSFSSPMIASLFFAQLRSFFLFLYHDRFSFPFS